MLPPLRPGHPVPLRLHRRRPGPGGRPEDQTSTGAALIDTSQEVATSVGTAVTGTVVAAAVAGSLTDIDASPAASHTFEHAITVATLSLTAVCTLLAVWAARRSAQPA